MTTLTRVLISRAFKDRYSARTGFDLDDPERRVPIRGHELALQLGLQTKSRGDRGDQLRADRGLVDGKGRARALTWLAPLGGLAGWPDRAQAHDHHPPLWNMPQAPVGHESVSWFHDLWTALGQIDLGQPVYGLAMGGALLMTQTIAVWQRHALRKAVTARPEPPQPDLFPETLPHGELPFAWESDSATRQGKVREENQDAVLVQRFDDGSVVLIVCDGAGGLNGGREASQTAVEAIGAELQQRWKITGSLSVEDLTRALAAARAVAKVRQLEGVTTALVVLLQQDQMSYATLGDGAVAVIWPDGMVGQVQVPHHTAGEPSNVINAYIGHDCEVPPRTGNLQLEFGAIVMAMSDGASDLFPFEDFALNRNKYRSLTGLADHLLQTLEDARDADTGGYLHSDNLTLAMARLQIGGDNDQAN